MTLRKQKVDGDRAKRLLCPIAVLLLGLSAPAAPAAPYRPTGDDVILERVPARSDLERLAPLRAAVAQRPADLSAALALSRGYIEIGRRTSDPRFIAYAQAALAPWLARPSAPEGALVLQAITLQYLHRFDESLTLLDRALALEPLDAQAWLTRAALLELHGNYSEARRACARLVRAADQLTALTCLSSVASRNGELAASYLGLRSLASQAARLPSELRVWMLSMLAEMAERLGDDAAAEGELQEALGVARDDPYLKAMYADLLLRLNRPHEVIALLAGSEAQDALLLRLAIAARRAGEPEAQRWAGLYADRLRAAERARDFTHQREQAMYLLEVRDDPPAALIAAASNWALQREPSDLRVYAAAAQRVGSLADRQIIRNWLADTHYEDKTLTGLGTLVP